MTHQEIVKIYQWGKVLHAPHSHTTISSICEQISFLTCLKHEYICEWLCFRVSRRVQSTKPITHLTKIHDNTFTFLKPSQWFKNVAIGVLHSQWSRLYRVRSGQNRFDKSCSHIYDEPISTLFIVSEPDFWICPSALMHRCDLMNIPAVGFDPTSSELWAPRAPAAPCRW